MEVFDGGETDESYHNYLNASSKFIKKDPFSKITTKEKTKKTNVAVLLVYNSKVY